MTNNTLRCPKKIWFLWFQGQEHMPELVRQCFDSWQRHHPDWQVIFLDNSNLWQYLDIQDIIEERENALYPAAKSDVIRINLLNKHGGVWVDATTFCMQALDEWLPDKMSTGFFAFNRPGKDRLLSSWFLAANENHPLVATYAAKVNALWREHSSIQIWTDRPWVHWFFVRFKVHGYLEQRPTLWFHPIVLKTLKVYPYFWFHYLFEQLYCEDEIVKMIWDETPKVSADGPHKMWSHGLARTLGPTLKAEIDERRQPLYKLSYKFDPRTIRPGCALDYLLNSYIIFSQ